LVTLLSGLCLAVAAVAALPARADIAGIPVAGQLAVDAQPTNAGWFPAVRLGKTSEPHTIRLRNPGLIPVTIGGVALDPPRTDPSSAPPEPTLDAFSVSTDCIGAVLLPQASCEVAVSFRPLRPGTSMAILRVHHDGDSRLLEQPLQGNGVLGLYQAGAFGELLTFGDAQFFGDLSHVAIESPILAVAATPSGEGYWLMEAGGRVHPFGDAPALGSPSLPDPEYAVSLVPTPSGKGYWLATQAGGIYSLGDAGFFGSAAGTLGPEVDVVDMAAHPGGKGYWLLDSNGGVHAFGDARFFGAAASLPPRYPVTGLAATGGGGGYWLIDALGGIFAYGDAQAFPADTSYSAYSGETALQDAVISIKPAPYGQGFVYGRLRGGFAGKGVVLPIGNGYSGYSSSPGYGSGGLQNGSAAMDLAFNVPPLQPGPEAGKVVTRGEAGFRAPAQVCSEVPDVARQLVGIGVGVGIGLPRECALTPTPPSPPQPAPVAPPAAPVRRPGL
jgi:hypothetical protein